MIKKIRIVASNHGLVKKVFIDGVEQKHVTSCFVNLVPRDMASVYLKYQPSELEIDLEEAEVNEIGEDMEAGE